MAHFRKIGSEPGLRQTGAEIPGWGDLNLVLDRLIKKGEITSFTTNLGEEGDRLTIELVLPPGSDQTTLIRQVLEDVPECFSSAHVRTRAT